MNYLDFIRVFSIHYSYVQHDFFLCFIVNCCEHAYMALCSSQKLIKWKMIPKLVSYGWTLHFFIPKSTYLLSQLHITSRFYTVQTAWCLKYIPALLRIFSVLFIICLHVGFLHPSTCLSSSTLICTLSLWAFLVLFPLSSFIFSLLSLPFLSFFLSILVFSYAFLVFF